MLRIVIKTESEEQFDETTQRFIAGVEVVIAEVDMEHSLASLSKWEAIHKIPFLSTPDLASDLIFDYLKCMVVSPNIDPNILYRCSKANLEEIQAYINSGESATTFGATPQSRGPQRERITSELIYYWMATFQIPIEAETWHLSRLLALVKIFSVKNSKPEKRSASDMAAERARVNAERRAKYNTTG